MKNIDKLIMSAQKAFAPGFSVALTYSDGTTRTMEGQNAIIEILAQLADGRGDSYIVTTDQPEGSFVCALLGNGIPQDGIFVDEDTLDTDVEPLNGI